MANRPSKTNVENDNEEMQDKDEQSQAQSDIKDSDIQETQDNNQESQVNNQEFQVNNQGANRSVELSLTETEPTQPRKRRKRNSLNDMLNKSIEEHHQRVANRQRKRERLLNNTSNDFTMSNVKNDPLLHFSISMYESTKQLPQLSQHKIKTGIFALVAEEESKTLSQYPSRTGSSDAATYSSYTPSPAAHHLSDQENLPHIFHYHIVITQTNCQQNWKMRLLSDIGFVYGKRGRWKERILLPGESNQGIKGKNVNLIYTDESWTNIGASVKKEWKVTTIKNPRDAFVKRLITGLKAPTQRGPRFVLLHAGTEEGFVDGAELTFLPKKGAEDYHDEIDGDLYEDWFERTLIPSLPKDKENVVVLDNASYHSRKFDFPKKAWNKAQIQAWLIEKGIFFG
ncbi:hypothetical protein JTB14_011582 [Gonioctena quinquepunctata]|nr:hypothetical protein JTB14_011582 [Gonioctena quinquepunctata]